MLAKGIIYGKKASLYEEYFEAQNQWESDWNDL